MSFQFECIKCKVAPKFGWVYMPDTGDEVDYFFCDECVPRGCSCNDDLKEGIDIDSTEATLAENYVERRDERGRLYPCCEYFYVENDFSKPQRMEKRLYGQFSKDSKIS
jgi:hypothetical protein